jgi:hypothetical protein
MKRAATQLVTSGTDPQIYYLHVRLGVPRQNHRPFVALMDRLLSVIHDLYGWELVHASYPITGEVNQFVHVWKIPDPDDVLHMMRHGAFNPRAAKTPARASQNPDSPEYKYFRAIYWELQGLITETTHLLTTALPADPNYEGYQTHTLLIARPQGDPKRQGSTPEWYLLDHEEMKAKWQNVDVRECVDAVQFWNRRERLAGEPLPNEPAAITGEFPNHAEINADEQFRQLMGRLKQREEEATKGGNPATAGKTFGAFKHEEVKWAAIEKIRDLLNFGVTHASVENPLGDSMATLVNLSALKPRSVQQEGYMPPDEIRKEVTTESLAKSGVRENLIIVAPWGSIYCVTESELEKTAKQIDFTSLDKPRDATNDRIRTFVNAQIPLGTILEPRDGQIGDGCACYVINLSAIPEAQPPVPSAPTSR